MNNKIIISAASVLVLVAGGITGFIIYQNNQHIAYGKYYAEDFNGKESYITIDENASQGYVVIALGHPMDAALTEFDDGSNVPFFKTIAKKQYEPFVGGVASVFRLNRAKGSDRELAEQFDKIQKQYCKIIMSRTAEWEKDTISVIEYAKEHFSDLIDFDMGIGATGHSLGGVTAYNLCLDYPDISCGINLDGALFGDNMGKILKKPFLQISCKQNVNVVTRAFIDHESVVYKAVFKDMQHLGFTDIKHMMNIKAIAGKLDADVMHENMCKLHIEFFDTYLRKNKTSPAFESNDAVTITECAADV